MTLAPTHNRKADANPTKAFFVRMVTRDISLQDCILDLIDNSVDSAWRRQGSSRPSLDASADLSPYHIVVTATPTRFDIKDNCGGITLDDAADYAFTFGRKETDKPERYAIGVYGIGMKRAVFKMGADVMIRSTYTPPNHPRDSFRVPIDVPSWLADTRRDWDFDLEPDRPLPQDGVVITVQQLHPETSTAFGNPAFVLGLRRTIARDYALYLRQGLRITVNDRPLPSWQLDFRHSQDFVPIRKTYSDASQGTPVDVEVLAGMVSPPPDDVGPDEAIRSEDRSGWYVACNGRIVVAADRTELSGWGTDDWPRWHPQYAGFIGLVLFSADDPTLLPLTTTKRSVDASTDLFLHARQHMRDASRAWIDYTNARKQALPEAKAKENEAQPRSIFDIPEQATLVLPTLSTTPKVRVAHINYSMPLRRVHKLAESLGDVNLTYRDVGIQSFDYTYHELVGGD